MRLVDWLGCEESCSSHSHLCETRSLTVLVANVSTSRCLRCASHWEKLIRPQAHPHVGMQRSQLNAKALRRSIIKLQYSCRSVLESRLHHWLCGSTLSHRDVSSSAAIGVSDSHRIDLSDNKLGIVWRRNKPPALHADTSCSARVCCVRLQVASPRWNAFRSSQSASRRLHSPISSIRQHLQTARFALLRMPESQPSSRH